VLTSKVAVRSVPAGANVYVDNRQVGAAPASSELPFGLHTIRVELNGYKSASRTVDVEVGELEVPFELEPLVVTGQVNIFGKTGAQVYVDGSLGGKIPVTAQVSEGSHSFKVVGDDGAIIERSHDIQFEVPGRPVSITLDGQ